MIVCGTGHRPEDCEPEDIVRGKIRDALKSKSIDVVVSGMAAGYDLWLGDVALGLGIEVWAARPWAGHKPRLKDGALYAKVVEEASKVVNVSDEENYLGPWVYHKRNEWMVDNSTHVLAYWSGKKAGGTYACIKYANKVQRPVRNIYG